MNALTVKPSKRYLAIAAMMMLVASLVLASCGDPLRDIHVYGRFQDSYTEDAFEVDCDWERVNAVLDARSYERYGLRQPENASFANQEEDLNNVGLFYHAQTGGGADGPSDVRVQLTYGAITCNSVQSRQGIGERYFAEPMVEVYLYNPEADRKDITPDYICGYRAAYSLDGELALEEGQWFLDEDKDVFCRKCYEAMLKAIGKDGQER